MEICRRVQGKPRVCPLDLLAYLDISWLQDMKGAVATTMIRSETWKPKWSSFERSYVTEIGCGQKMVSV
jgi:hypothetical protein